MHAIQPDPRVMLAALVALLLALVALAATPSLPEVNLGGSTAVPPASEAPVTGPVPPPAWATDPLAPPALMR